ncbi:MAG TPA: Rieske 2Fe-2S domain-containing protein [Planctomycetaceae bacterium]
MSLHRVAAVEDLPPGSGREVTAGDRVVALFRVGDEFYAMDGICPHAGGPLGKGYVSGTRVTCPWHGWQFDVTTGRHCLTPNIVHETFPVVVEGGEVYVELP